MTRPRNTETKVNRDGRPVIESWRTRLGGTHVRRRFARCETYYDKHMSYFETRYAGVEDVLMLEGPVL